LIVSDGGLGPLIGVLALQGDFAAHASVLESLGASTRAVRKLSQLEGLDGLVIPGGESTALIKLMDVFDFWDPLKSWLEAGRPVFGTCAGAILLASEVLNPAQKSFALIDITVERNGYGRQVDSFEGRGSFLSAPDDVEMIFIRAPKIVRLGEGVESLGQCRGDTVVARQGNILVSTFHPELSAEPTVHGYFLQMVTGTSD
jgi:5'-phosphate synthase pdxT subunit